MLDKYGVEMIGANAEAIERGEDRQVFKDLMISIGLDVPDQRHRPHPGGSPPGR